MRHINVVVVEDGWSEVVATVTAGDDALISEMLREVEVQVALLVKRYEHDEAYEQSR